MEKAKSATFYAVHKGRKPGIYDNWKEIELHVGGFAGAVFKKFNDFEQARRFFELGTDSTKIMGVLPTEPNSNDKKRTYLMSNLELVSPKTQIGNDTQSIFKKQKSEYYDEEDVENGETFRERTAIKIYTDGACRNNGKKTAIASYAIFFGDGDKKNEQKMLPWEPFTNQRAELYAILRAFEVFDSIQDEWNSLRLRIYTDSQYSINIFTIWIKGWKQKGYITATGKPVENKDIITLIDHYYEIHKEKCRFIKVKGHDGVYGNEMADKMANQALDEFLSLQKIK